MSDWTDNGNEINDFGCDRRENPICRSMAMIYQSTGVLWRETDEKSQMGGCAAISEHFFQ